MSNENFKMIAKIKAGADFIVTQTGWDMKKLHELILFTKMRDIHIPLIARLSLISEEDGQNFSNLGIDPGVSVSREFASLIQREMASGSQFMATQLKRLCLQIVGCSLMGYSGVQICGLRTAYELQTVMETAKKMMGDFRTVREWSDEWNAFHHGIEMVGSAYNFYMFLNLLSFKVKSDSEDNFQLAEAAFEEVSLSDQLKYKIASVLSIETKKGFGGRVLRRILSGDSDEAILDLSKTQYVSLNKCPKKLVYGPCSGSQLNGDCENGELSCVHNERISLAALNNELVFGFLVHSFFMHTTGH